MRYLGPVCGSLALILVAGCTSQETAGGAKPAARVPAKGVVKLDGKPLGGAVITFLPLDERGTLTVAESKDDGSYELTYQTFPGGTAPGKYRVGISYLTTDDGKAITQGQRSALVTPVELLNAKERLPAKYSHLGTSELLREVPVEGGTFDFDLAGPLIDVPAGPAEALSKGSKAPEKASAPATPPTTPQGLPATGDSAPKVAPG